MDVRVQCHAGYREEETPRRLRLGCREVVVAEVLDRWLPPDHRYFKVRGDDGARYILRHDVALGRWDLTLFERPAEPSSAPGCGDTRLPCAL